MSNTITPLSFASASQDYAYYGGLDKYTDGETFDADLALEYKEKAVAELTRGRLHLPGEGSHALQPHHHQLGR